MKYQDFMVDLETLGKRPGCKLLSLGGVAFSPVGGIAPQHFYVPVLRDPQGSLHEDPDTLDWWEKQSEEARKVFNDPAAVPLDMALKQLTGWMANFCGLGSARVWGNGADFDNAILAVAAHEVGVELGWKFWNNRCYRTIKNRHKDVTMRKRTGTHHNALDDAISQAEHLLDIFQKYGAGTA